VRNDEQLNVGNHQLKNGRLFVLYIFIFCCSYRRSFAFVDKE
jgi:hypothetical protein